MKTKRTKRTARPRKITPTIVGNIALAHLRHMSELKFVLYDDSYAVVYPFPEKAKRSVAGAMIDDIAAGFLKSLRSVGVKCKVVVIDARRIKKP